MNPCVYVSMCVCTCIVGCACARACVCMYAGLGVVCVTYTDGIQRSVVEMKSHNHSMNGQY